MNLLVVCGGAAHTYLFNEAHQHAKRGAARKLPVRGKIHESVSSFPKQYSMFSNATAGGSVNVNIS